MSAVGGGNCKPAICFVSPEAYGALSGQDDGAVNGAEFQQAILARHLAARGYPVSFVTEDHGQADGIELDGIRVFKAYRRSDGLRVVRFAHPRITGLWHAMKRSDADIYFQRTSDAATGIVAAFCRRRCKKFVFSAASELNCQKSLPGCVRHERHFYRYGLLRADRVIAQTLTQQRLFRENFGIDSVVIPNCAENDQAGSSTRPAPSNRRLNRLLWVGRWVRVKRFELLLDMAGQCPELHFDVVGDSCLGSNPAYRENLHARASLLPNVHLHGRVPHAEMAELYQGALALVCTSQTEGFPNTFVEAWCCGVPVVSTFDPDGVISYRGLGFVAHDVSGLVMAAARLIDSPEVRRDISPRARRHYLENHSVQAVIPKFEKIFDDLAQEGCGSGK